VKKVYDDAITIIQQNWYNNQDDNGRIIPMDTGTYNVNSLMAKSGPYTVLGWLRQPGKLTPQLSVATASGTPGATFVLSGTGFSVNSSITSHLKQPDGTELPTWNSLTNSSGNYSYNIDSSSFISGDYYAWVVDNTTNTVSNSVRFTLVSQEGIMTLVLTNINQVYSPHRLCQDNNYIYWTEYGGNAGGNIKKISKSGGNIITLISGLSNPSGVSNPMGIVVDSSNIYWADNGTGTSSSGIINQLPLSLNNWNITVLANGQTSPQAIAVDESHVYWAEYSANGSIKRVPINGGTIDILASGLYGPSHIAIDDNYVYWGEDGTGSVKKVNKSDKSVTVLASGLCAPGSISIDSSNVYWGDLAYGPACGVRMVQKNGGTITPLVLNLTDGIFSIATDENYVYYIEAGNRIMKIAVGGGNPLEVVGNLDSAWDLVVDNTYIYWIENGNTTRRIAKILK
jgi:hypothetical protein